MNEYPRAPGRKAGIAALADHRDRIDVRSPAEFAEDHIPGAINVDFNAPDFQKKVAELDKSKTYLVHCAGGVRSAKACTLMDKSAFTNLFNLDPGFRAWEKAGKPVEKK